MLFAFRDVSHLALACLSQLPSFVSFVIVASPAVDSIERFAVFALLCKATTFIALFCCHHVADERIALRTNWAVSAISSSPKRVFAPSGDHLWRRSAHRPTPTHAITSDRTATTGNPPKATTAATSAMACKTAFHMRWSTSSFFLTALLFSGHLMVDVLALTLNGI